MEWIANPTVGEWLNERLDHDFSTMHGVVPRGYETYARVFHPGIVTLPSEESAPVTWGEAARAFGTTLHAQAQWRHLVRTPVDGDWHTRTAPDGREFSAPMEGELDADLLVALAGVLAEHTATPDAGFAALWEGWGGLLGHMGLTPSRTFFAFGGDDPKHQAMLDRSSHDPFNNVFRKETWQEGILSREISEGPRLELPDRAYVLFSAAPRTFADPDWILDAPWRDRPGEAHGFPVQARTPSILWPEDRAWTMVSEIDFDSTIVAGSAELIAAICADDRIEALVLPADADLTWDADEVNR